MPYTDQIIEIAPDVRTYFLVTIYYRVPQGGGAKGQPPAPEPGAV